MRGRLFTRQLAQASTSHSKGVSAVKTYSVVEPAGAGGASYNTNGGGGGGGYFGGGGSGVSGISGTKGYGGGYNSDGDTSLLIIIVDGTVYTYNTETATTLNI
jgi:hypothetical protein